MYAKTPVKCLFFEGLRDLGRSSWGHLGSLGGVRTAKVALRRASWRDRTAKVGLVRRIFDQIVDFMECMKNTGKTRAFWRFDGLVPVKLGPLGQPKGGQDSKSGLAQGQLRGRDGRSGSGKGQLTVRVRERPQTNRKSSQVEAKVYLTGQSYD